MAGFQVLESAVLDANVAKVAVGQGGVSTV
ncbi:MAG: hypothetical protein ACJAYX_004102 [Planctomycetota bacterium]|jgi:hypothetical protein